MGFSPNQLYCQANAALHFWPCRCYPSVKFLHSEKLWSVKRTYVEGKDEI